MSAEAGVTFRGSCGEAFAKHVFKALRRGLPRHAAAMMTLPDGPEKFFASQLITLARYADEHKARFGSDLAGDYVLGAAWLKILKAFREMLNGETGDLDAGTLDRLCYEIAQAAGFTAEQVDE